MCETLMLWMGVDKQMRNLADKVFLQEFPGFDQILNNNSEILFIFQ